MNKLNKQKLAIRLRAFGIWQKLGYFPWRKPAEARDEKRKNKSSRDFYKGAFDSIPFLNNDAKRTFTHLLLRPGYMIRDYIKGDHERYLAPFTSLIIFYAFFALVAALLQPVQQQDKLVDPTEDLEISVNDNHIESARTVKEVARIVQRGYIYLNLDKYPEEVHTRGESALAALEGTLRSQGIPLFLGEFFLLWFSMSWVLRKRKIGMSAAAAASAYVLCQFSFFMLFALFLTLGKITSLGLALMLVLVVVDYHQWLGVGWWKSFRLTVRTGLVYALLFGFFILFVSFLVLLIAWFR